MEEFLIFLLGSLGFMIFIFKEKKLAEIIREKLKIQRKANSMSKDLISSYSYIGEMNRKVEILKNIFTKITEIRYGAHYKEEDRKEVEDMIIHAIKVFLGKNQRFCLSLFDIKNVCKSRDFQRCRSFQIAKIFKENKFSENGKKSGYWQNGKQIVILSPHKIKQHKTVLAMRCQSKSCLENLDIIKLLLTQLLFVASLELSPKNN